MVIFLKTKAEFDAFLEANKDKLVVIDFTATWCGPCKRIGPVFEKLSAEFTKVACAKVDVDENEETSESCEITAMPTFLFYKDGEKVDHMTGANETQLREKFTKNS